MWECPVVVGQRIEDVLQLDAPAIIAGAAMLGDTNPLHSDAAVARASRFGSLIACGPHAAGLHACMLPTYVTGLGHGVVGVEFTLHYRKPILPDVPYVMWWEVATTEPRGRHWHVEWIGAVGVGDAESITATGSVLILETRRHRPESVTRLTADARPCETIGAMTVYRIRFEGPAALAVHVATEVADADGVELISSKPVSILDDKTVRLDVSVEGERDDVTHAVAAIRGGMPKGASIEIVHD